MTTAKLEQVIELKSNYVTPARMQVGKVFKITRAVIGERGIIEKVNSNETLSTSKIKSVEIVEELISIATENTIYHFEVI